MASRVSPKDDTQCEGCQSKGKARITYRVEGVNQKLCDDCAQGRHDSIRGVEKNVRWFCKEHQEREADVFCDTHQAIICNTCTGTSMHTSCQTKGIHDVIADRKRQLIDLMKRGQDKEDEIKQHDATVDQQALQVDEHLKTIDENIIAAFKENMKTVEDVRDQMAKKISQNADGEVKAIDKKITENLKRNQNHADKKLKMINSNRSTLDKDMTWITTQLKGCTQHIKSKLQSLSSALKDAHKKAEELILQEKVLMSDFHDVTRSLTDSLQTEINEGSIDEVRRIADTVSFVREDGERIGRIDGISEKWEVYDEYSTGDGGRLKGSISKDRVAFDNDADSYGNSTFLFIDLNDKSHQSNEELDSSVSSCASLDDGRIACGTYGPVVIYDQTWTRVRTINVPSAPASMIVSLDKDGRILAAGEYASTIHVFNPDNGKLLRKITVQDINIEHMHALSSGDIAVFSEGAGVRILDASGAVKSTTHLSDKFVCGIAVDRSRDSIFILYIDHQHDILAVDVMSSNGVITSVRILEFKTASSQDIPSIVISQSGKLAIYNGGKLLFCRKTGKGLHEFLKEIH